MINSLSKDSHITQSCRLQKSTNSSERRVYNSMSNTAPANNSSIIVKKPAEISFSGLSNVTLAKSDSLKILNESAKQFLAEKANHKTIKDLIMTAVEFVQKPKNETNVSIKNFLATSQNEIQSFIKKTEELVVEENLKNPLKKDAFDKETKNTMSSAIDGFAIIEDNKGKKNFLITNKGVKGFLDLAADSEPLFNATFSIALTCILRPASIMTLPSNKKNNDDKKYAAAHSIAAGVISYFMALIIFNPVADAMKKIAKDPGQFIKGSSLLGDKKAIDAAGTYIKMLPETILAIPRAVVTIALIPPILKYVFGWEKKKTQQQTINTPQNIQGGVK